MRRRAIITIHGRKPWKLITSNDPDTELDDGHVTHHGTLIEACNAFQKTPAPYRTIIYDDGHQVRELDERERRLLENVCTVFGLEIEDVER
jgi:hypothetical protein